uniref:Speedy protein n=1 Tax=Leptobrachium leishanense TaxID=445787 RepID=A0A8C5QWC9_9ANUR
MNNIIPLHVQTINHSPHNGGTIPACKRKADETDHEVHAKHQKTQKDIKKRRTTKSGKKQRSSKAILNPAEKEAFYKLLENDIIKGFLEMDSTYKISDQYLLAMVAVYFKRAKFNINEYTRMNFFVALLLATLLEEEDDFYGAMFPWALGENYHQRVRYILRMKNALFKRMDYRALVSRSQCEQIFAQEPNHWAWKRQRQQITEDEQ